MENQQIPEEIVNEFREKLNYLTEIVSQSTKSRILDEVELRELLKISRRTSLEYRQKKYLRFHRFSEDSKIFYLLDELIEDIRNASK